MLLSEFFFFLSLLLFSINQCNSKTMKLGTHIGFRDPACSDNYVVCKQCSFHVNKNKNKLPHTFHVTKHLWLWMLVYILHLLIPSNCKHYKFVNNNKQQPVMFVCAYNFSIPCPINTKLCKKVYNTTTYLSIQTFKVCKQQQIA